MPIRKVHFYELRDEFGQSLPAPYDATTALRNISMLDVTAGEAYLEVADQTLLGRVIDVDPPFKALYRIRREDLPSMEVGGQITDLQLAEDAGLAEGIHIRFFPQSVVGILYNHFGPRPTRVADYLNQRSGLGDRVSLHPLIRTDIVGALQQYRDITILDMSVPVGEIDVIEQRDRGLASALQAAEQIATMRNIELRVRLDRAPGVTNRVRDLITRLFRRGATDSFRRLKIKGLNTETGKREWFDILAERITVEVEVETRTHESRTVADASARTAIGDAYNAVSGAITEALRRGLDQDIGQGHGQGDGA